ncbi:MULTISPECIES: hypothetical protein [unclassified Streptomyces]|uniref:hypothetical protein n=1 Tax=unclassified Streptomyces TaxID=2593676 RepID=UPI0034196C2B
MGLGVRWTLHGDGRTPAPGAVVRPDERLSWPRTAGLGAQHVACIALGTIVVITGYHTLRYFAPAHLKTQQPLLDSGTSAYDAGDAGDAGEGGAGGEPAARDTRS